MANNRILNSRKENLWHFHNTNWIKVTLTALKDILTNCSDRKYTEPLGGVLVGTYARKKFVTVKRAFFEGIKLEEYLQSHVVEPIGFWRYGEDEINENDVYSMNILSQAGLAKCPVFILFRSLDYKVYQFDNNGMYGEYETWKKIRTK